MQVTHKNLSFCTCVASMLSHNSMMNHDFALHGLSMYSSIFSFKMAARYFASVLAAKILAPHFEEE